MNWLQAGWASIAIGLVLILPGAGVQVWLPGRPRDPVERLADALGLSLALDALLALCLSLIGIRIQGAWLLVPVAAVVLVTAVGFNRLARSFKPGRGWLLALAVFIGLAAWRLYQARAYVLPAWIDSPQHVLIVRKIMEFGGLPPDLSPYLEVPFYYHYAFHIAGAVLASLSRLPAYQAVLILGQVLSAAACLSVYRLAKVLWGETRRAVAAALLVAFLSPMPAFYLTWGRDTLLTGMVVLPLAMAAAIESLRTRGGKADGLRLALLTAGVLLSHYLAGLLLAAFLLIVWANEGWGKWRDATVGPRPSSRLLCGSLLGLALAAPWLFRVWAYARSSFAIETVVSTQASAQAYFPNYAAYLWQLAGPARGYLLLALGCLGILTGWARSEARTLVLWSGLIALASLPIGLRVGPFRPDHFVLVLFLPASLLASESLVSTAEAVSRLRHSPRLATVVVGLAVAGLSVWGAKETVTVGNPETLIADAADRTALVWIAGHTDTNARFWINTLPWQLGLYRGVDGGAWITAFTGRWSLLPSIYYGAGGRDSILRINLLAEPASRIETCTNEFWRLVDRAGINYVYVKQGRGAFQPTGLEDCEAPTPSGHRLRPVYQEHGVFIFQVGRDLPISSGVPS